MAFNRTHFPTVTRVVSGIDPSTPTGLSRAVANGAIECLQSALHLDKTFSDLTGEYMLVFHAIELGLKAFLIKQGFNAKMLRSKDYGHNLVKLYAAAKQHGLAPVIPDWDDLITWINEWHSDRVKIRYEFAEMRVLPKCDTLFPLAAAIINACK
jgi:hypothetical protein